VYSDELKLEEDLPPAPFPPFILRRICRPSLGELVRQGAKKHELSHYKNVKKI
jgi:hypothetical protein